MLIDLSNQTDAYNLVDRDWYDCSIGFTCVCGEKELQVSDEAVTCDNCKRIYRLHVFFTLEYKEMANPVTSAAFFDMLASLLGTESAEMYRVTIVAELDQPLAITIERWADQAIVDGFRRFSPDQLKASVADDNSNPNRA